MNKFVKIGIGVGIALAVWFVVGMTINLIEESDPTRFDGLTPFQISEVLKYFSTFEN